MVGAYFDTGVLAKAYVAEVNSPSALALLASEPYPLPFTHFQEVEIRTAIRLKLFRREITVTNVAASLALLAKDVGDGRLVRPSYVLSAVFGRGEDLSRRYAGTTGARTLDILHVASALEIGSRKFISFDNRQRAVAKKVGLKILP